MNGCQYAQSSFTLPVASSKTTDMQWDLAFLPRDEFTAKYEISDREYDELARG